MAARQYRAKPRVIEAWQVTDDEQEVDDLMEALGDDVWLSDDDDLWVETPYGNDVVATGDWIARDADGALRRYTDAEFESNFELAEAVDSAALVALLASFEVSTDVDDDDVYRRQIADAIMVAVRGAAKPAPFVDRAELARELFLSQAMGPREEALEAWNVSTGLREPHLYRAGRIIESGILQGAAEEVQP